MYFENNITGIDWWTLVYVVVTLVIGYGRGRYGEPESNESGSDQLLVRTGGHIHRKYPDHRVGARRAAGGLHNHGMPRRDSRELSDRYHDRVPVSDDRVCVRAEEKRVKCRRNLRTTRNNIGSGDG